LKNGKSPDERHISAEHLKYGGRKLLEYLTVLDNWIFENLQIPKTLKSGIACPILKKGKPAHDPNSYRKDKMRAAIMGISPCVNPFCSLFCCSVMALLFLVRWIFSITLPIRFVIVIFL
jgi:hypothetical protein